MSKVKRGATWAEAFARLDADGIVAVVGDKGKSIGHIHDMDIRTALLDGADLSDEITVRAKRTSRAATPSAALPIAVIMAGGRGERLRPLTDKVPKPLLKVGTTSIVERIMSAIALAGIKKVYLSVNYKAKVFEQRLGDGSKQGVELSYLKEVQKLDTAGALSLLPGRPKVPILVTNADILTRLNFARLIEFHRHHGKAMTVAGTYHSTTIPYGVISNKGARLVALQEKPELKVLCNAGIYVLEPEVLQLIRKDESVDMPSLIERVRSGAGGVNVFPIIEKWFDIGSYEDFQRVLMEFATYEEE
ncbi:MAG: nucleotidyltransferase family protein [Actinomycetota bacterium]